MSKSQRTKGADGEREVCRIIHEQLGVEVSRNLSQTREGGADIKFPPFSIEVKRRSRIGNVYEWMEQSQKSCSGSEKPIVICRADRRDWLVVMPISQFLQLVKTNN
ncbi:hypothetical protein [uncultured Parasutterella sp.]|uniref:putative PDDEXK endonuclease n=1 Tax=uncultured Parasutterella sp. TaxID=1263098 RepID=UPI0025B65748|nr:hypothetical protein [uncultured Parasutterella sp.]